MHIPVWIITPPVRPESTGIAFREAERIAQAFHEENFRKGNPDEHIMPPLRYDWRETGGRWSGSIDPETGNNWAFGKNAAGRPDHLMPQAVITPEGYAALRNGPEETEDIRRVLLHWPDNIVVAQDWHY